MKVLIITYYWPPSGGSGVQRWLKMAKYLPEFGCEPIIYTPQNPELMAEDRALLAEVAPNLKVWKQPIWEPYAAYKFLTGKQKIQPGFIADGTKKQGWRQSLSLFIRSNCFFPDPRCFWRCPSVRYLRKRLAAEPVDWIITTGPPQSMHLIGRDLHRKTGIPWLADFRDPWTGIYYFKHLKMLPFTLRRHKKAERSVVQEATAVTVVSPQMRREFLPLQPRRIEVIPNGYDETDFAVPAKGAEGFFSLCHTGLFTRDANPEALWEALAALAQELPDFREKLKIRLIGQVDAAVRAAILQAGLEQNLEQLPYLPHLEAVAYQKGADVLLLSLKKEPESKGIITGKFFEYLAAGKPILGIGPCDGDLAEMLADCGAGSMHEFEDFEGCAETIKTLYTQWCAQTPWQARHPEKIAAYTRRGLCERLVRQLLQAPTSSEQGQ